MNLIDEFRNTDLGQKLIASIRRMSTRKIRLIEFSGGHTVAIFKHGIRQLLPDTIEMLSGPGCPVCVTSNADLDRAIALASLPNVTITTFGDMIKVPGSYSSLERAKATGSSVSIVYSARDALAMASANPEKPVIFIGVGFETTAPTIAAAIIEAKNSGIRNFYVLSLLKICPPIIKTILDMGETKINGIIGPGHVSSIIGSHPYQFIAEKYRLGCVISGFEPLDILLTVAMLVKQYENDKPSVEIAYTRGVKPEGNRHALQIMNTVFEETNASWRGIGVVPESGLAIREEYEMFDASRQFSIAVPPPVEPKGCLCGEIVRGTKTPRDCKLYRVVCTPENPIGPCMVSHEGACSAYYLYGEAGG